jgi:predicted PurR-regulated permease PerM
MEKKVNNRKKIIKIMIVVCIILILILLLLIAILGKQTTEEVEPKVISNIERTEKVKNLVKAKSEKERIQIYLAEYIKHIEREEYEEGYNLLSDSFKANYFNTLEEYKSYTKRTYSNLIGITYKDIQRQGNYYILSVTITNLENDEEQIEQNFVIFEKGLNDYELSFQVK